MSEIGFALNSKCSRRIAVTLPNGHMDEIGDVAAATGVSASQVIRDAVAEWIERRQLQDAGRL